MLTKTSFRGAFWEDVMFKDRFDAGRRLATALEKVRLPDPIVYALPRGGVPTAAASARMLRVPLHLLFVRKVGAPFEPELALGAVIDAIPPKIERNEEIIAAAHVTAEEFQRLVALEIDGIARRRRRYALAPPPRAEGRTALVIDDGVATGASARVALAFLREQGARRIVFAAPVGSPEAIAELSLVADEVVCLLQPNEFCSVGAIYEDFTQVSDAEMKAVIEDCARAASR